MTDAAARPGLSIVICTARRSPFLGETLQSVLNQSYQDWEVILLESGVDSGVDDIAFPAEKLRRIRTRPETICGARNRGIAEARAPLVAFLDDDDRWLPAKAARQVEIMSADPRIGLTHTECQFIDVDGAVVALGGVNATNYEGMLAGDWRLCSSSTVYRRDVALAVGGNDPRYPYCGDMDLLFKVARRGPIYFIRDVLTQVRIHKANTSKRTRITAFKEARGILKDHRRHALAVGNQRWASLANDGIDDVTRYFIDRARRSIFEGISRRDYRESARQLRDFATMSFVRGLSAVE